MRERKSVVREKVRRGSYMFCGMCGIRINVPELKYASHLKYGRNRFCKSCP